jgi:hypothetical protein
MYLVFDLLMAFSPLIVHFTFVTDYIATSTAGVLETSLVEIASYVNWVGFLILYGVPLFMGPFTFFDETFGTEIIDIYLNLNEWGVLVGGVAFYVVVFAMWIAAATMNAALGPWLYFGIETGVFIGIYVGYYLFWNEMNQYYAIKLISAAASELSASTAVDISAQLEEPAPAIEEP